jgi:hypothetical protein
MMTMAWQMGKESNTWKEPGSTNDLRKPRPLLPAWVYSIKRKKPPVLCDHHTKLLFITGI